MNSIGSSITKSVGTSVIRNAVDSARSKLPGQSAYPNIRWENFNYPPLLKIVHYDLSELEPPHKGVVRLLNITFILTFVVSIINFINSIAQTAVGFTGLRILYSILNLVIFIPISLFAFYKGYRGLVFNKRELKFYYVAQVLLAIAYFIFSIISGGNYNGWIRVSSLFHQHYIFQGILGVVESIIYLINSLLMVYCMLRVKNLSSGVPPEDRL